MGNKIFKTLDEQIEILKEKNLQIDDVDYAKKIILRENYFFLMGYRHLFLKDGSKKFIEGTNFRELYALFSFDRQMRNIMFKNILIIENNTKSIFSYVLSQKYGYRESDYLRANNYNQSPEKARQVNDLLKKMKRQIRVNGGQHEATKHYINNYGYIPLWVVVKVLSFGIISELYSILKPEDQLRIADIYGLKIETLEIYLGLLANFRNLCAHEDILYDHKTQRAIPNDKVHAILNIEQDDFGYIYGKDDLFALVIIMKYMLTDGEFKDLINEISYEIDILDGKVDVIPLNNILNRIGFPDNWRDIALID